MQQHAIHLTLRALGKVFADTSSRYRYTFKRYLIFSCNKHVCLRANIAFADLRKQCSDELEIMRIREDNANVTNSNNKDPLCLSIGRQSAESINGNLFACYVFRNVYSDERRERIN